MEEGTGWLKQKRKLRIENALRPTTAEKHVTSTQRSSQQLLWVILNVGRISARKYEQAAMTTRGKSQPEKYQFQTNRNYKKEGRKRKWKINWKYENGNNFLLWNHSHHLYILFCCCGCCTFDLVFVNNFPILPPFSCYCFATAALIHCHFNFIHAFKAFANILFKLLLNVNVPLLPFEPGDFTSHCLQSHQYIYVLWPQ